jgi:DMSO reductase family type II enzyme chaperone
MAVARAFIYRFLAKAYEDPVREGWDWLCAPETAESVAAAWSLVAAGEPHELEFQAQGFDQFHDACIAAFGHAARGNCPLNEIEYGDIKADPLFQPHRLADLAAFYRAFGLEVAEDADERHDHLCLELEFMCVLAAKEGYALEHHADGAQLQVCLDAQKKFLREHLGRWTPAFTRRLAAATGQGILRKLADFTRRFIELECARFGIAPGSGDLALRPVDDSADRMCDSCGLSNLPPGALAAT